MKPARLPDIRHSFDLDFAGRKVAHRFIVQPHRPARHALHLVSKDGRNLRPYFHGAWCSWGVVKFFLGYRKDTEIQPLTLEIQRLIREAGPLDAVQEVA